MKFKPITGQARANLINQLADSAISTQSKDGIKLLLRYGNYSFNPPPVCTAHWDFNSWCKELEAQGVEPLNDEPLEKETTI